jgi:sugar phosphate isomerase/epimerase
MTYPLGIAHFTCIGLAPVEFARLAARVGYRRIGLRLHPAFPGAPTYAVPEGSLVSRELQAVLDGEGLAVYDIEFVVIDAFFEGSTLEKTLADAAALGARRLSVCGDDPDRGRLVARFADLCERAARHDLAVDLECMAWRQVATVSDAVSVVEAAGRPNAGVLVDALHLTRGGGTPETVRNIDHALIRHAQLCDAGAVRPDTLEELIAEARGGRLLPGEGALPLRALLAALPDDAALSVEVPMRGSTSVEEHARAVFAASQALLANRIRSEIRAQRNL